MIVCQERAQSQKINVPNLHHYLKFSMIFVSEDFGTMNGPGRSGYACIRSQKESTKHDIARISHRIRSVLQLFLFDIAPNLLILHTPQWNNPNK